MLFKGYGATVGLGNMRVKAENRMVTLYQIQVTEKNVIKLWQLRGNDTHTYDITNNLHNAIIKLATDIANINNLTKEEQETIYGVLEGTINHKNIEK